MIFEFELWHVTEGFKSISEPEGWDKAIVGLERHPDFHSLIEYYNSEFSFYGSNGVQDGGREWVKNVKRVYGPDATIVVYVRYSDNDKPFKRIFLGQVPVVKLVEKIERDHKLSAVFQQHDFWSKFIARFKTPVDIQSANDIYGDAVDVITPINVNLPSQLIPKTTAYGGEPLVNVDPDLYRFDFANGMAIDYAGGTDTKDLFTTGVLDLGQSEIEESFTVGFDWEELADDVVDIIEMKDESGEVAITVPNITITLRQGGQLHMVSVEPDHSSIFNISILAELYIRKNGEAPILLNFDTDDKPGPANPVAPGFPSVFEFDFNFSLSGSGVLDVVPGDIITVYIKYTVNWIIDLGTDTGGIIWDNRYLYVGYFGSNVSAVIQSSYPATTCPAFLQLDAFTAVADRVMSVQGAIYSEYMGNAFTHRAYGSEGCASNYLLLKGLHLRGYTLAEKQFFMSMEELWNGVNPIFNLGLGYARKIIDSVERDIIEIEGKEKFYDDSAMSTIFYNVRRIEYGYDEDLQFNNIKVGYEKFGSEAIQGLDDPQTEKTYVTAFRNIGKKIEIISKLIAGSLSIEETRRTTKLKSADYRFDNDTFILNVIRDGDTYKPRLNEGFSSVTNLVNESTRYNKILTPARMFIRWKNFLQGCLQNYPASLFKFAEGKGNYKMTATMDVTDCADTNGGLTVAEDGSAGVEGDFLFLPEPYTIYHYMTIDQYEAILANRKLAVGVSQTDANPKKMFIDKLEYQMTTGKMKARLLAKERLELEVLTPDATPPGGIFDDSFDEFFE